MGVTVTDGDPISFSLRSLSLFFSFFSAAKSTTVELEFSLKTQLS